MRVRRLIAGETFAGRYRVEGFLGQGAMGSVYRVVDTTNGEERALKVMSADIATAPDFLERFLLEAKIGETIQSEHVVRVFDSGSDDKTKLPYFAMELLDGMDLHRLLEAGTELDAELARAIVVQLFQAMRAAHLAKVVHRDLKPENLFIVMKDGAAPTLKVLDFGVAKVVREVTAGGTAPGLGTPLWAAPEQGKEGQIIKPSSDVWALGLLTYRLLAGKIFWLAATERTANAFDLAVEMLRKPIPPASERSRQSGARELGKAFDAWFAQAVDRDPAARFADAGRAWDALEPILKDRAPASAAPSVDPSVAGAARAARGVRPWLVALAVVTVAVGLIALALSRG